MSALDDLLAAGRAAVLPAAGSVVQAAAHVAARLGVWSLHRPSRSPGQEPPIGYYSDEVERPFASWDDLPGSGPRGD